MNFNKTYKNRFDKKNKKRFQKKRGSQREVNAVQKSSKDAPKDQPKKEERFEGVCFLCGEKGHKFFKCPMRELVEKLRKEGQASKAMNLNHTKSQGDGEVCKLPVIEAQVRLGPESRIVSCLLDIGSDLTIASPELKEFSQNIEEDQVSFSGAGSYATSRESGTLSIKLGSASWESVVAHFAKLPAGIDVLLGIARIKTQDFVFQVQTDQPKELKDQLEQVKQPSQSYVPGLNEILEKHQEVFALEKWSAASNLPQ